MPSDEPHAAAARPAPAGYSPPPASPYGPAYGGAPSHPGPGYGAGPPSGPPRQRPGACVVVDQTNERYDLRVGSNIIGRGTDADFQLLDQGISRRHLDIQFDGNFATAYDLGSTNGTTVNGHEVGSQVLRHGDVVRIGHTRLVFHHEPG
jgi:hypothetical protein